MLLLHRSSILLMSRVVSSCGFVIYIILYWPSVLVLVLVSLLSLVY
jgi:hypothetical protein